MSEADRLAKLQEGCTTEQALAFFDELPAVRSAEMFGRWRGSEVPTGNPFDGLLTASGWYGKQFDDPETVHPLLFTEPGGGIFAVDPRKIPIGLASRVPAKGVELGRKLLGVLEPALRTKEPRARLRELEYRGKVGAAMIYDHLPIIDIFRKVDDDALLGVMDRRGDDNLYFFALRRDR
jgi:hypothetical protein